MPKRNLTLSEEQEENLKTYLDKRVETLETVNGDRIKADLLSWNVYENSREDRRNSDSIFEMANLSIPLTSMIVDHFSARADDALLGTSPYFDFDAQGPSTELTAKDFDKYFHWKLETRGKTRSVYSTALRSVYIQRQTFLKAVYKDVQTSWEDKEARVLFDKNTGEPVQLFGIGFVIEGEATFAPMQMPDGSAAIILEEDPTFELNPEVHEFRDYDGGVPMITKHYQGPKAVEVTYDRILVPDVRDLQDADCIVEKYDKKLNWIEDRWADRPHYSFAEYKTDIRNANAEAKTGKGEEKEAHTPPDEDLAFDTDTIVRPLLEIWLRRDVLGKGREQDIYVLYDPEIKAIINYEYTAKMTPDAQHPYSSISIRKRRSLVESLLQYQNYVDLQFNSESYRNALSANPMTGVDSSKFRDEDEDFEVFPGKKINMKEDMKISDAVTFTDMPQHETVTQKLLDFVFGVVQLWLGVSNLAQGDYQALAPANTATGVEATLQEASKIGKMWMRDIIEGLEHNLMKLVQVAIHTVDEAEAYEYMEGDVRSFGVIDPNDLQNLDVKVTVVLSPQRGQRDMERNELILKIVERYLMYPAFMRPFVRPALEEMLGALGVEDVTKFLPEEAPDMPVEAPPAGEGDGSTEVATAGMGNSNKAGRNQNTG